MFVSRSGSKVMSIPNKTTKTTNYTITTTTTLKRTYMNTHLLTELFGLVRFLKSTSVRQENVRHIVPIQQFH